MRSSGKYLAFGLAALTLAYGLFQARTLMSGPVLAVTYPMPGSTVSGPTFTVRGEAHNVSRVRINGRAITTDPAGGIDEELATPDGYSVLLIEAENRLGRYTSERIEFVGKPMEVSNELLDRRQETKGVSEAIHN